MILGQGRKVEKRSGEEAATGLALQAVIESQMRSIQTKDEMCRLTLSTS